MGTGVGIAPSPAFVESLAHRTMVEWRYELHAGPGRDQGDSGVPGGDVRQTLALLSGCLTQRENGNVSPDDSPGDRP